jgi:hypothetical protein
MVVVVVVVLMMMQLMSNGFRNSFGQQVRTEQVHHMVLLKCQACFKMCLLYSCHVENIFFIQQKIVKNCKKN